MAADSRSRIVSAAQSLMVRQGYHATGINSVIDAAGVSKGSFYHHFPDKAALLTEMLEHYVQTHLTAPLLGFFETSSRPKSALIGFTDHLFDEFSNTDFRGGCLLANMALELGDTAPRLRETMHRHFAHWRSVMDAHIPDPCLIISKPRFLTLYIASVEGVTLLARLSKDPGRAREAFKACHDLVDMAFVDDGLPVLL